jgi:hypothetical protein
MEIWIKSIPIKKMRWGIMGDYFTNTPDLTNIRVAETGNLIYDRLLAIHETIEDTINKALGITDKEIDDYCDKKRAEGIMPDSCDKDSPIHDTHMFCDMIERMVCEKCGIKQEDYNRRIDELLQNKEV